MLCTVQYLGITTVAEVYIYMLEITGSTVTVANMEIICFWRECVLQEGILIVMGIDRVLLWTS